MNGGNKQTVLQSKSFDNNPCTEMKAYMMRWPVFVVVVFFFFRWGAGEIFQGEGSGGRGGGKRGSRGREVGVRGREAGVGEPPVHLHYYGLVFL